MFPTETCHNVRYTAVGLPPRPWTECEVLQSACPSVCLSASISQKPDIQTATSFRRILSAVVARSSSCGVVRCYALPVSWMTSYVHEAEWPPRPLSHKSTDLTSTPLSHTTADRNKRGVNYSGGGMPMARHRSVLLSPRRYISLVSCGPSTIDGGRRTEDTQTHRQCSCHYSTSMHR